MICGFIVSLNGVMLMYDKHVIMMNKTECIHFSISKNDSALVIWHSDHSNIWNGLHTLMKYIKISHNVWIVSSLCFPCVYSWMYTMVKYLVSYRTRTISSYGNSTDIVRVIIIKKGFCVWNSMYFQDFLVDQFYWSIGYWYWFSSSSWDVRFFLRKMRIVL